MWWEIDIWHGPGHQSHTVNYEWYHSRTKKSYVEETVNDTHDDFLSPMLKIRKLRKLPEKIRLQKLKDYQLTIKACRKMINRLK